jgi:Predicted membrane protein
LFFLAATLVLLPACATFAATGSTTGEQKTAVILVNFQDEATQPISVAAANILVFGKVSDFYWEGSYQKTFLSGNTFGWFTIPVSKTICNVALIAQEADKAATAAGVNLAAYDRLIYLAPQNSCTVTGYNSGPTLPSRTWIFTNLLNDRVIAHELGHNFGLLHSQALDCGATTLGDGCAQPSYGDAADTMGNGVTPHFNAYQKEQLGWLNTAGQPPITTVSASGNYAIAPYASMGTAAKALKVPRGVNPQTGKMQYYYIEYRQPVGFDAVLGNIGNLTSGVLVHTTDIDRNIMLLDMTPDSDPTSSFYDIRDSALPVGRTFADSAAGVSIKLVSADASGATIEVGVGGGAPVPTCTRAAPTITLSGTTTAVAAGSSTSYTVTVSNKDSSACAATSFALARSVPSGWIGSLAATSLSLSPGTSASTSLSVTSSSTATAGSYGIGVGVSSAVGSVHTANASSTYSVATATGSPAITGTVGTDKTSYRRGQTVYMSARVLSGGVAVNGASVKFTVTLPTGASAVLSATSGSDGYARNAYKLGKAKSAIGSYTLRADASSGGSTATSNTAFSAM